MELAGFLSERYNRNPSSISITVRHGLCVFFGGSFDPAYILSLYAVAALVQPATNKRNIALIQRHLEKTLKAPASRGFVRFVGMSEESFGTDGQTLAGLMDQSNQSEKVGGLPHDQKLERKKSIKVSKASPSSKSVSHLTTAFGRNDQLTTSWLRPWL